MAISPDVVLLGAGHHALILQAYLGRCGLSTVCIEASGVPGGGLATVENERLPGFLHHPHSFFHRGLSEMPWYRDLELRDEGVEYLEPERNVVLLLEDGRSLEWWTDLDRTEASFAQFDAADARALRRWVEHFRPVVDEILVPEAQSPPLEPRRRAELLSRSELGRRLLSVQGPSPLEFVTREFRNDVIRAGLLFFNGLREIDLRLRGFGHAIPALLAARSKAQICVGGSGRLAGGLCRVIRRHRGEILCGRRPKRLLFREGRVRGVELDDGERILARRCVVSGLNPQQTFVDLMPGGLPGAAGSRLRSRALRYRYNVLAPLFALHLALREPPRYSALRGGSRLAASDNPLMVIIGLERFDQFDEIVAAHERGVLPPLVAWGASPTVFDATQAPPGKHTAFLWQKVPYRLLGDPGRWEREGVVQGERLLELWSSRAPNLRRKGVVLDSWTQTPVDTEARLPNMIGGDLLVGSFARGQVGYNRPFPGAGRYRSPLEGLYLCGSSTHPGGNVTGLCGYNAAAVIAADLALECWWNPPDFPARLESLAAGKSP